MKRFLSLGVIGLSLIAVGNPKARGDATNGEYSRKTITLSQPAVIGGIPVRAGQVDEFEPGDLLAHGVLSQDFTVQALSLPAGTDVNMDSPGRIALAKLPSGDQPLYWIANAPFSEGAALSFAYSDYLGKLSGQIAYHPQQYSNFPSAGLSLLAFENDSAAECTILLSDSSSGKARQWNCSYSLILSSPIQQNFGGQSLVVPALTTIYYGANGITALQLSQDQDFMGLPVSASEAIRIDGSVAFLRLSKDATYNGLPVSAMSDLSFYNTLVNGLPVVLSYTPSNTVAVVAGQQSLIMAAFKEVNLNLDGSLLYGSIASAQSIQGNLFPAGAVAFFGNHAGTPLETVGLQPETSVVIDGVTYGQSNDEALFLDFDPSGKVIRAR